MTDVQAEAPIHVREAPHHRSWPLIGSSLAYIRDAHGFLRRLYEQHGEVTKIDAFGTQCHFLLGPDANQWVLQNSGKLFENARWNYFIGPFFKRGLMLLDGDEHLGEALLAEARLEALVHRLLHAAPVGRDHGVAQAEDELGGGKEVLGGGREAAHVLGRLLGARDGGGQVGRVRAAHVQLAHLAARRARAHSAAMHAASRPPRDGRRAAGAVVAADRRPWQRDRNSRPS